MCIAIYKRIGNEVPKEEYLKNCWSNNSDGAGFAFNVDNRVQIVKGLMTWDSFKATFDEYNKRYNFKDRGLLIHFRIETHGGVCPECTHPFPLSSDEGTLQKKMVFADYAVIHNGIISLTSTDAAKKTKMSDTMCFIQKYMSKIATNRRWFYNDTNFDLIYDLADSKIAVLNAKGEIKSTPGFEKGEDGNYYSNTTYKWGRTKRYAPYYSRYDYYNEGGWYGYDGYDYGYSRLDSPVDGESTSIELMKLKPSEWVWMEDNYDLPYDETCDIYITRDRHVFLGDKTSSTFIVGELAWMGDGDVYDHNNRYVPFRSDCSTWKENVYEIDEPEVEEEKTTTEHEEKETKGGDKD